MFELIVACTPSGVIGNNNTIPWHIPEDLTHFRKITEGHIVIMGRKTFESLPNQIPLKKRYNIVLTSLFEEKKSMFENLTFTNYAKLPEIIDEKCNEWGNKVFVIGGTQIYKELFPLCNKLHITNVKNDTITGNIVFPYDVNTLEGEHGYEKIYTSDIFTSKVENLQYQFTEFVKKLE